MTHHEFSPVFRSLLGFIVFSLLVATVAAGPVAAHTGDDGFHHHDSVMGTHDGMDGWMVGGFGFLWMLLWTLVLIGIPVGIGYLILSGRASEEDGTDDALDLLRQRYAQGEIDDEEFETRRSKLLAEQN